MEINYDTPIEDIVSRCDGVIKICLEYGLSCLACGEPIWSTLGEAMDDQGIKNKEELLEKIREYCKTHSRSQIKLDI